MNHYSKYTIITILILISTSITPSYALSYDNVTVSSSGDINNISTIPDTLNTINYEVTTENQNSNWHVTEVDFIIYSNKMVDWNAGLSSFVVNGLNMPLSDLTTYAQENGIMYEYKYTTPTSLLRSQPPISYSIDLYTNLLPEEKLPVQIQIHYNKGDQHQYVLGSEMNYLNAETQVQSSAEAQSELQQQQQDQQIQHSENMNTSDKILQYGTIAILSIFGAVGIMAFIYFYKKQKRIS